MKPRAKYGVDAPGIVRTHIGFGAILALMASIGLVWPKPNPIPASLSISAASIAALLLFGGRAS